MSADDMNAVAEAYVRLVLEVGLYDPDYVDAYYGPEQWKPKDKPSSKFPHEQLLERATGLQAVLEQVVFDEAIESDRLRRQFQRKQLNSLVAKIDLLGGARMTFDEESLALYDAVAPAREDAYFDAMVEEVDATLPGDGDVPERLDKYLEGFIVPSDRLPDVFGAAIDECRARAKQHLTLPADENFIVEYVKDKPWGAYNWYKGNNYSVIEVNTDLPTYIGSPVHLAAHEGYPGHHVQNLMAESLWVKGRGWAEFSVAPLFCPYSLIMEGGAEFGVEVAFPGDERLEFERRELYPRAGLDPALADDYHRTINLTRKLRYARIGIAREYIEGHLDKDTAVERLCKYLLTTEKKAAQQLKFMERYRSYLINYDLGQEIVRAYIEKKGGTEDKPTRRWELLAGLLSEPQTPSGLA